jgi:hypothetical protein
VIFFKNVAMRKNKNAECIQDGSDVMKYHNPVHA